MVNGCASKRGNDIEINWKEDERAKRKNIISRGSGLGGAGACCVINLLSNRTYYVMPYKFLNELIYLWILKATHQFKKIWAELIDSKVASWMWVLNVTKTGHSTSYTSDGLTCRLLASWFDSYGGIERRRLVHFLGATAHLHREPSFFIKGFRFEWGRMWSCLVTCSPDSRAMLTRSVNESNGTKNFARSHIARDVSWLLTKYFCLIPYFLSASNDIYY